MRVRFKENACGFGFGYCDGAEAELSQAQAEKAIALGCAVAISKPIETAESKAKPETATFKKKKGE